MKYYLFRILHIFPKVKNCYYRKWNIIKFYLAGATVGKGMNVCGPVYINIEKGASLHIGENFKFNSGRGLNPMSRNLKGCIRINPGARIIIGNNVGMSSSCLRAHKSIRIGSNVKIGGDAIIVDSDSHSLNYVERRTNSLDFGNKIDKEIIIDDDVLIGTRCVILKGVHIGARSVIGAGSVVTKDVPPDCIAAGNPCRVIKYTK